MNHKTLILDNPENAREIALQFLKYTEGKKKFAFYGAMGAGKTTFIRALCQALGVQGPVTSPTFALINEYHGKNDLIIYHFDFYRIQQPSDILDFGGEEYFDGKAWCFVEWPEKAETILPEDLCKVRITEIGEGRRRILIEE